jgi:hypothetical protein
VVDVDMSKLAGGCCVDGVRGNKESTCDNADVSTCVDVSVDE